MVANPPPGVGARSNESVRSPLRERYACNTSALWPVPRMMPSNEASTARQLSRAGVSYQADSRSGVDAVPDLLRHATASRRPGALRKYKDITRQCEDRVDECSGLVSIPVAG